MFYVLDENHNLIPAYDKEGVLAVLEQAIADGSLEGIVDDSAFVSKLKCCVGGGTHHVAFVTTAKYNELVAQGLIKANCLYYITDDTSEEELDALLEELTAKANDYEEFKSDVISGQQVVGKAKVLSGEGIVLNANSASEIWFSISETGIYMMVAVRVVNSVQSILTGLIAVPSMQLYAKGISSDGGTLEHETGKSSIHFNPQAVSGQTPKLTECKLYRIGDI